MSKAVSGDELPPVATIASSLHTLVLAGIPHLAVFADTLLLTLVVLEVVVSADTAAVLPVSAIATVLSALAAIPGLALGTNASS